MTFALRLYLIHSWQAWWWDAVWDKMKLYIKCAVLYNSTTDFFPYPYYHHHKYFVLVCLMFIQSIIRLFLLLHLLYLDFDSLLFYEYVKMCLIRWLDLHLGLWCLYTWLSWDFGTIQLHSDHSGYRITCMEWRSWSARHTGSDLCSETVFHCGKTTTSFSPGLSRFLDRFYSF